MSPASFRFGSALTIPMLATLTITYTPEPGTLVLLGAGIAALAASARHRAARSRS